MAEERVASIYVRAILDSDQAQFRTEIAKAMQGVQAVLDVSLKLKKGAVSEAVAETQKAFNKRKALPKLGYGLKLKKGAVTEAVKQTQIAFDRRKAVPQLSYGLRLRKGEVAAAVAAARKDLAAASIVLPVTAGKTATKSAKTRAKSSVATEALSAQAIANRVAVHTAKLEATIATQFANAEKIAAVAGARSMKMAEARIKAEFANLESVSAIAAAKAGSASQARIAAELAGIEKIAAVSAAKTSANTKARIAAELASVDQIAAATAAKTSANTKARIKAHSDMLDEIGAIERVKGDARAESAAYRERRIIEERAVLTASTAAHNEAQAQGRITAAQKAGLDARSMESVRQMNRERLANIRHANNLVAIHTRAEVQKRGITRNTLRLMRNDLAQFDASTTRTLRRLTLAFGAFNVGVGAAFAGVTIAAAHSFAQAEQEVARAVGVLASDQFVKAMTEGEDAVKAFDGAVADLSKTVMDASEQVAIETIFNTTEVAEGARALAQAGLDSSQIIEKVSSDMNVLGVVARFAQNEQIDLADATEQLTGGFYAAGLDMNKFSDQLIDLTDKYTFVANATNASATQVAQSFSNRAAPAMKAYGQTVDQTLTVLALLSRANIRGLTGGEQLGIMARFITQGYGKATETWKRYGIEMEDANGKQQPFTKTLYELTQLWNRLSDAKGAAHAQGVFRDQLKLTERSSASLRQIMPQINAMGLEGINTLERQIAASSGATERQASVFTNTLSFQFEQFLNELSALARRYSEPLANPLRDMFKRLNGETEGGISLFQRLGDRITSIGEDVANVLVPAIESFAFGGDGANFFNGLEEGMRASLRGMRDGFRAFREEVFGEGSNKGFFTVLGEGFAAVGRFSAEVMPIVGRVFGQIIGFVRENTEVVKGLFTAWMALFATSKALRLFIIPLRSLIDHMGMLRGAIGGILGLNLSSGIAGMAKQMNLYTVATEAAANATDSLARARLARDAAATGLGAGKAGALPAGTAGPATAAVAAVPTGLARVQQMSKQLGSVILKSIAAPFLVAWGYLKGIRSTVVGIGSALRGISLGGLKSTLGTLTKGLGLIARFAGPIGIIVAAIQFAMGAIRGFIDGIKEQIGSSADAKKGLEDLGSAFRAVADIVGGVLGIIGDVGATVGRFFGRLVGQILASVGQITTGITSLFSGDWLRGLKLIGAGIANALTAPLRFAISFVIDLFGDLLEAFGNVPGMDWADRAADQVRNFSREVSNFKIEIGEASDETDRAKKSVDDLGVSTRQAAILASEYGRQHNLAAKIAKLSVDATKAGVDRLNESQRLSTVYIKDSEDASKSWIAAAGGFTPVFEEFEKQSRTAFQNAHHNARNMTASMLAQQGALQASLGQTRNAYNSMIDAGLQQALADANAGIGALSPAQARANIAANKEYQRQQKLIRDAKKANADMKLIEDAIKLPDISDDASKKASKATKAVEKVKTAAELATEAVNKMTIAQFRSASNALVARIQKVGVRYRASAMDAELLARTIPLVDKAMEKQTKLVSRLDDALQRLQETQLAGTRAASEAAFAFDQQQKALELQRVNLQISGVADDDPAIEAIDAQIEALRLQAQRAELESSLALDPLKKKIEETFSPPPIEMTFDKIISEFQRLSSAKAAAEDNLAKTEELKKKLDEVAARSADRFSSVGINVTKGIQKGLAAGNAALVDSSKKTADAVSGTVKKQLGIASPSRVMNQVGIDSMTGFNNGISSMRPALTTNATAISASIVDVFSRDSAYINAGRQVLTGFKDGMRDVWKSSGPGWGNSIQEFVKNIAEWIKDNKGPISYDAQLLRPAGEAMMSGFKGGLQDGFSEIKGWVKRVGPSLATDTFPKELFIQRSARFLINNAKLDPKSKGLDWSQSKSIDAMFTPGDAFGDLLPADIFSGIGAFDPSLSFLHKTLSAADTKEMALRLVKMFPSMNFNPGSGQFLRAPGTRTSSGNISAHTEGTAVDLGTGGARPTAESLRLFGKLKSLLGTVFRQLIHNGVGLSAGGGSFPDSQHFNHIHAEWMKGIGFSRDSGKKGVGALDLPGLPQNIGAALMAAAQATKLSPTLLAAVSKAESGWNPTIGSPAGARGLMQLMPGTAASLGVTNILDPFQNALGGAKYLKQQLNSFGSMRLALAAYNAGPGAVAKFGGVPPFKETQEYIQRVLALLAQFNGTGVAGRRAMGGRVAGGSMYEVGELGRELFIPERNGSIITNRNVEALINALHQPANQGSTQQTTWSPEFNVYSNSSDPATVVALLEARMRAEVRGIRR